VSLASLPPAVSWPGASFPPRGPEGRFPRFKGTTRRSDSPPPLPPRFVAFTWRYLGCTRVSLPASPGAATTGLELVTRYLPPGLTEEVKGPPRFLEGLRARALLSDPGGIARARPLRRRDAAFRHFHNVGSRDFNAFGAQSHGPFARCLRFAARVAPAPRKTRSRLLASSAGRGWLPARSQRKVSAVASPFPKLSWRTQVSFILHRFQPKEFISTRSVPLPIRPVGAS
jgi:hypothetical protein